eukprot:2220406-Amphidinium_carterae.3
MAAWDQSTHARQNAYINANDCAHCSCKDCLRGLAYVGSASIDKAQLHPWKVSVKALPEQHGQGQHRERSAKASWVLTRSN